MGGVMGWFAAARAGGELAGRLAEDLREFVVRGGEVPESAKQVLRLASSEEVVGLLRGVVAPGDGGGAATGGGTAGPGPIDIIAEKLLTPQGTGFVSTVVGTVAREAIEGYMARVDLQQGGAGGASGSSAADILLDVAASEHGRDFLLTSMTALVSKSVGVYLDKTIHINPYEQMLESAAKPEHGEALRLTCGHITEVAVRTWVQESRMFGAPPPGQQQQGQPFSGRKGYASSPEAEAYLHAATPGRVAQVDNQVEGRAWPGMALSVAREVAETPELRSLVVGCVGAACSEGMRSLASSVFPPASSGKDARMTLAQILLCACTLTIVFVGIATALLQRLFLPTIYSSPSVTLPN